MAMDFTRTELEDAALLLVIDDAGAYRWSSDKTRAQIGRVLRTISYEISAEDVRAADFPAAVLEEWHVDAAADLESALRAGVTEARDRGCSWATIGEAFGITRQAAWERFRRLDQLGIVDPVEEVVGHG